GTAAPPTEAGSLRPAVLLCQGGLREALEGQVARRGVVLVQAGARLPACRRRRQAGGGRTGPRLRRSAGRFRVPRQGIGSARRTAGGGRAAGARPVCAGPPWRPRRRPRTGRGGRGGTAG